MRLNKNIFISCLNNLKYFEKNPHIAVGVSGGPDSMALVYLLHNWIKLKKGRLTAIVFDHKIRSNSKTESFQVKGVLNQMNIETVIIKPHKNQLVKKNMLSARENRFRGIINFCKKQNILHLFLGHHFDDNLETFLIRKVNGSNLEGLASMDYVTNFKKILILRPLIDYNKSEILKFNLKNKIKFISDPSNKDINFTRIKIRNFLQNNKYKNKVKYEFLYIKKQIPNYKKMIWEIFIFNLSNVSSNQIKFSFKNLITYDDVIVEKIILCLLKFFTNKKTPTKSSKIMIFIENLKKPSFKTFNLSGVIIKKSTDFLTFNQN